MKKTVTWELYPTTQGRNVNFVIENNHLKIELNPEGREFIEDLVYEAPDGEYYVPFIEEIIFELAEDIFCNSGWEIVRPEEVGALTDGLLIADYVKRGDDNEVLEVGNIYWDSDYMVRNLTDDLMEEGFCILRLGA